jgi:hypothetical protein
MVSLADNLRQSAPPLQALLDAVQQAPSLTQMVLAAWRLGLAVALLVLQEVLMTRAQAPTAWPVCPQCGARLRSKGFVARQLMTLLGVVHWQRRVGRCPHGCAIGQVAPLDTALGLTSYQATSGEVQQLACALAVFVPFETAAALWRRFVLALPVSPAAIWGWVQGAGQRAMARLEGELVQLAAGQEPAGEPLAAPTATLPLLIGADGVLVPFRPQAATAKGPTIWREIKVAILARLRRRTTPAGQETTHLERRRLVAVLGDIDALTPRLWLEALRQGVRTAPLVAWLSDGGRGFWRLFAARFAGLATGILDFYHVAQHLWTGAAAWLGAHTPAARTWFESARHRLRHGESHAVLAELAETLTLEGLPASAHDTLQKLYDYLDKHRAHIDYEKFKELGLPLGSGMVESACKWLIQQRFKGVGMRWSEDGFNHLLHLRLAWVNGRFDALFLPEASPNL